MWMIQFKDTENGKYRSSNDAISFAIAAAQKLGMRGERAHVCMRDDDGRLRRTRIDNLPRPLHFPPAVIEFA
jgi:hypothetical protein